MGRPSGLTEERHDAIVAAIEQGRTQKAAAVAAGVGLRTLERWLEWGRRGEDEERTDGDWERYRRLWRDATRALEQWKQDAIDEIRTAVKQTKQGPVDDWQARAWLLERRFPEEFAASQRIEVKVEQKLHETLDAIMDQLSPSAQQEVTDALARAAGMDTPETGEAADRYH